jgi:hypothetical protein
METGRTKQMPLKPEMAGDALRMMGEVQEKVAVDFMDATFALMAAYVTLAEHLASRGVVDKGELAQAIQNLPKQVPPQFNTSMLRDLLGSIQLGLEGGVKEM